MKDSREKRHSLSLHLKSNENPDDILRTMILELPPARVAKLSQDHSSGAMKRSFFNFQICKHIGSMYQSWDQCDMAAIIGEDAGPRMATPWEIEYETIEFPVTRAYLEIDPYMAHKMDFVNYVEKRMEREKKVESVIRNVVNTIKNAKDEKQQSKTNTMIPIHSFFSTISTELKRSPMETMEFLQKFLPTEDQVLQPSRGKNAPQNDTFLLGKVSLSLFRALKPFVAFLQLFPEHTRPSIHFMRSRPIPLECYLYWGLELVAYDQGTTNMFLELADEKMKKTIYRKISTFRPEMEVPRTTEQLFEGISAIRKVVSSWTRNRLKMYYNEDNEPLIRDKAVYAGYVCWLARKMLMVPVPAIGLDGSLYIGFYSVPEHQADTPDWIDLTLKNSNRTATPVCHIWVPDLEDTLQYTPSMGVARSGSWCRTDLDSNANFADPARDIVRKSLHPNLVNNFERLWSESIHIEGTPDYMTYK
ncbi:hypothetical protein CANCADRAFT_122060 [Tortispora caseinolytica NRRL Y-17796]|uniref:Uncharacterized protein n=1 Tax=Tortispora caseinolytica NRRL Y-17796 TaxID=767744 RepID=A0A1E4THQ9_9ASCO|nr:hypothetical protein CANCADRAFT_122060 [Tortispora caseinolytica NRRL Y-17796]